MRPANQPLPSKDPTPATRASVTFPSELYQALEALARQKRVSLAWIVRDAAERYVTEEQCREPQKGPRR